MKIPKTSNFFLIVFLLCYISTVSAQAVIDSVVTHNVVSPVDSVVKHNVMSPVDFDTTKRLMDHYAGAPFLDSVLALVVQTIPGKVQCEFYDQGGEGVAYHDVDNKNSGSGDLNKGPGYLNNFRKNEAVDISYTKFKDSVDNSKFDLVQPAMNQLYLGWTEPGEWVRYTVEVAETGYYKIGAMYTSNRGGSIRFTVDDTDSTSLILIPSTYNQKDPKPWRQWHHWNYSDSLTAVHLMKGRRILKLLIVEQGNFNFDYFNFEKTKKP